jgi:hypothetical protein
MFLGGEMSYLMLCLVFFQRGLQRPEVDSPLHENNQTLERLEIEDTARGTVAQDTVARDAHQIEVALLGHHWELIDALDLESASDDSSDPCHDLLVKQCLPRHMTHIEVLRRGAWTHLVHP